MRNCWLKTIETGLQKEEKTYVLTKYGLPCNLLELEVPELNPEIKAALTDFTIRNDMFLEKRQTQLGKGLSILGSVLNILIKNEPVEGETREEILLALSGSAKFFCDLHYRMSLSRRSQIMPALNNKGIKEVQ
ncbi:unnamed protein product, partial [Psylliodes chrysocephalus]